jgi:AcrR family transcriptional regulator
MVARTPSPSIGPRRRHDLDSLLRVATAVFTERGYDGTSMEDLARATGLSKSSIYHHVEGKEQLLRLALERAVGPLGAITTEDGARQGPAIERLEFIVHRAVEVLIAELESVTLLLRVRGNTGTERWALDRRRAFDRFVAAVVAQAAEQGDVRPDVDPLVATRLLFGMVNSLVEWYRPPGGDTGHGRSVTPDQLADAVVRLAFDGLRTPQAPPAPQAPQTTPRRTSRSSVATD